MRFTLIDRITHLEEGVGVTAIKGLSMAEEYLEDHFPRFPVMPGVLMIESMYQAAAWLIRKTEDFANPVVQLKEVRNVKFQDFVAPGQVLTVSAEILKNDERTTTLKARGTVDGKNAVSARLIVERFSLAERYSKRSDIDSFTRRELRKLFDVLYLPS